MGRVAKFKKLKSVDPFNSKAQKRAEQLSRENMPKSFDKAKDDKLSYKQRQLIHSQNQMKKMEKFKKERQKQKKEERAQQNREIGKIATSNEISGKRKREDDLEGDESHQSKKQRIGFSEMRKGESYREYSKRLGLETRDKLRALNPVETKTSEKRKEYFKQKKEQKKLQKLGNDSDSDETPTLPVSIDPVVAVTESGDNLDEVVSNPGVFDPRMVAAIPKRTNFVVAEEIKFGEVAQQPPDLRHVIPKQTKKNFSFSATTDGLNTPSATINNFKINAAAKESQSVSSTSVPSSEETSASYQAYQQRVQQSYKAMQQKRKQQEILKQ